MEDKTDQINLYSQRTRTLEFEVSSENIDISELIAPNGELCNRITLKDANGLGQAGKPQLPYKTLQVLVPFGYELKDIEFDLRQSNIEFLQHKLEASSQKMILGSDETPEYKFDSYIYGSNNLFPGNYYSVEGVYGLRGYQILVLNLFPVQYIPSENKLLIVKDMRVKINLEKDVNLVVEDSLLRGFNKDEEMVLLMVQNPEDITSYRNILSSTLDLPPASYDYVIITNDALKNSGGAYTFQDLADYKNSIGISTTIVTVEDIYANYSGVDNQEKIRNFIIDAYNEWGIEYVLLGGDGDGTPGGDSIIPTRGFYDGQVGDTNVPSDLYYAALDGNWNDDGDSYWGEIGEEDLYAEVYVGRAPVDSEQELSNFIMKTLAHETTSDAYLSEALMLGEYLGSHFGIPWGGASKDEVKDGSTNNGYETVGFPPEYNMSTLYDRDLDPYEWDSSDLIPILNSGVHVINHLGHANVNTVMKMTISEVDSLVNDKYFFVYSQGCYCGAFDNRSDYGYYYDFDCIVEHFVTSEHGAFAFVANSRYGVGDAYGTNGPSQFFDRQFFDAIFNESIVEIGRANQDSKHDTIPFLSQDYVRFCYYELNLFGDPTANLLPQPNEIAPILTSESVAPKKGYQDTQITFRVNYTDSDNNAPSKIHVIINGTKYNMEKQDQSDKNYTDGCMYQLTTYLQSASNNYSYFFQCSDGKFMVSTAEYDDIEILYSNAMAPSLSNSQLNPPQGYTNATTFEYAITYTDPDNNAPSSVNVTIDSSSTFEMIKQDPLDDNYIDGCLYRYSTTFENAGIHDYSFSCSDGVYYYQTGTESGPDVEVLILPFDGMYINYMFTLRGNEVLSRFEYSYQDDSTFLVNWMIYDPMISGWYLSSSYEIDVETRLMKVVYDGGINFGNYHTPMWIYPNVLVGDLVPIAVDGEGDHDFLVSEEKSVYIQQFGDVDIFELVDLDLPGGIAWYEKTSGILLNGSYPFYSGTYEYSFNLLSTNVDVDVSGGDDPIADFIAVPNPVVLGNSVQFMFSGNPGHGTTRYTWDFGDTSPLSYEQNPIHIYATLGTYQVTLSISDSNGGFDSEYKYILVEGNLIPCADFYANTTVVSVGEPIQFTFSGSPGNEPCYYVWIFDDGGLSQEKDPVYQFTTPGTYSVEVYVSDVNGDSDNMYKSNYITVYAGTASPEAEFEANSTTVRSGEYVQFTFTGSEGDAPATFFWDFGDGLWSDEKNPVHQYMSIGSYTVSLEVYDSDGDLAYEEKNPYIIVYTGTSYPMADFIVNTTTINPGEYVQFIFTGSEGDAPATFFWDFGDGGWSDEKNPVHQYTSTGSYMIYLEVYDSDNDYNYKIEYDFIRVVEEILPIADFYANTTTIVEDEYVRFIFNGTMGNAPASYTWDFGDETPVIATSSPIIDHTYTSTGTYTITLLITDADLDNDIKIRIDYITVLEDHFPLADFHANSTMINPGEFVQFTFNGSEGDGPAIYMWNFGDGITISYEQNPIHQYTSEGVYNVTLTVIDSDGDSDQEVKYFYMIVINEDRDITVPRFDLITVSGFDLIIVLGATSLIGLILVVIRRKYGFDFQ
ncbi:MAG: PKD domain-containing protein [Candidatus Lokiarchaeota archaeon]|nr:PKD domain-containing protein [Candidatus Lokiarchaeota archaeon]